MKHLLFSIFLLTCFSCKWESSATKLVDPNCKLTRGMSFAMTKVAIVKREKSELVNRTPKQLSYTTAGQQTDFSDIVYEFDSTGKLSKIQVDFYAQSPEMAQKEFKRYQSLFSEQYLQRENIWIGDCGPEQFTVFLKLFDNVKDPGLFAVWEKQSKTQ